MKDIPLEMDRYDYIILSTFRLDPYYELFATLGILPSISNSSTR